jgi:hypothetical protein
MEGEVKVEASPANRFWLVRLLKAPVRIALQASQTE